MLKTLFYIFLSLFPAAPVIADVELFSNNADTILSSAAADSDTTIYVQDATGFQSPGAGEFQRIILADGVDYEIVTLTGVSGSALTVTREQEGTTAPTLWAAGTRVLANFTAATLGNFCQEADTSSFCGADPDLATLDVDQAGTTISTFAATFTDDADAAAVRTTLDVDQAGTDNSTDVTLGGTGSYCSLAGQALTCNLIDLSSEITGTLGTANGGTGQTSLGAVSLEDFGNGCTLGQIIDSDGAGGSDCLDFSGSLVYEATDCTALSGYVQGNSCWDATTNTLYVCESANCDGSGWVAATAAGDGVGYDTIQDNGSAETQRAALNLISGTGATVSCADNAGSSRTDCTVSAIGGLPRGYIDGLITSRASVTSVSVTSGVARDDADTDDLELTSTITKTEASWAVGTASGGLDGSESSAGSYDNTTWYFVWLIKRSDTGVVDVLFSESNSSPTLPTNYDEKQLIGMFYHKDGTDNILQWAQYGDEFKWVERGGDGSTTYSSTSPPTAWAAIDLSAAIPPLEGVIAKLQFKVFTGTSAFKRFGWQHGTLADPSSWAAGAGYVSSGSNTNDETSVEADVVVDASGQIKIAAESAANIQVYAYVHGWRFARGKNE